MFTNIGKKIKILAQLFCWLGIIGSIISGVIMMVGSSENRGHGSDDAAGILILVGILIIIVGSLLSWVSSFVLYGFGELIDNSAEIKKTNEDILVRTSNIAQNVYLSAQNNNQQQ